MGEGHESQGRGVVEKVPRALGLECDFPTSANWTPCQAMMAVADEAVVWAGAEAGREAPVEEAGVVWADGRDQR